MVKKDIVIPVMAEFFLLVKQKKKLTWQNKMKTGLYRNKYVKNIIVNVTKFSKTKVYFSADFIRFVYDKKRFLFEFRKE